MTARTTAIAAIAAHTSQVPPRTTWHDAGADIYGQYVFGEDAQRQYLAKPIFKKLRRTIDGLEPFDPAIVDAVAHAVKEWAMAQGATHYTHWFVPMTGSTAEKHDSFLAPTGEGTTRRRVLGPEPAPGRARRVVVPVGRHPRHVRGARLHRVGRHLADLPPGRAQRRHAHDPDRVRLVHRRGARPQDPAAALAGGARQAGAAGPPLVRQPSASRVFTNIGPEQEYFLVDRRLAEQRPDLLLTGRTLFGAPSPKGQELEDQYFGSIRERILAFMMDLDRELWRLGIPAQDAPQRGRAGAVRDGAGVRADLGRAPTTT